jgi:hypothetical protein
LIDSDHHILTMKFAIKEHLEKIQYRNVIMKEIKKEIYIQKLKFTEKDWDQLTESIEQALTNDKKYEIDSGKFTKKKYGKC